MADLMLRDTDPDELVRIVADAVVERLRPILADDLRRPRGRDDMADWLGIGVATLDRMVRANDIPSAMLAGRRVFIPADVVAALSAQTQTQTQTQTQMHTQTKTPAAR